MSSLSPSTQKFGNAVALVLTILHHYSSHQLLVLSYLGSNKELGGLNEIIPDDLEACRTMLSFKLVLSPMNFKIHSIPLPHCSTLKHLLCLSKRGHLLGAECQKCHSSALWGWEWKEIYQTASGRNAFFAVSIASSMTWTMISTHVCTPTVVGLNFGMAYPNRAK